MKLFVMRPMRSVPKRARGAYMATQLGRAREVLVGTGLGAFGAAATAADMAASDAAAAVEPSGMFLGELVVIALLGVCAWVVVYVLRRRKREGGAPDDGLRIVGATALGPRERAVVLRARGRSFLLGVTATHVSLLAEFDDKHGADAWSAAQTGAQARAQAAARDAPATTTVPEAAAASANPGSPPAS
jgi:flagellar protein FliO/FliZ